MSSLLPFIYTAFEICSSSSKIMTEVDHYMKSDFHVTFSYIKSYVLVFLYRRQIRLNNQCISVNEYCVLRDFSKINIRLL